MIMKRNLTRWKKYILVFVIAIFMLLCFGQHRVQAAITRENTQDGFKLSGTGKWKFISVLSWIPGSVRGVYGLQSRCDYDFPQY